MLNEADTRVRLIDPILHQTWWAEDKIVREWSIAHSRSLNERGNGKKIRSQIISLYIQSIYNSTPNY